MKELIEACDMIDIVTPTVFHHEVSLQAIAKKKHVFIEKPIANSVFEAKERNADEKADVNVDMTEEESHEEHEKQK